LEATSTRDAPRVVDERTLARDELGVCTEFLGSPSVTWIDVDGVHDVPLIQELGEIFHLHALVVEDILNTNQRPKLDEQDEHLCIAAGVLRNDRER